ncbi:LacI family DNA-binding transcriptional regulator [Microbacterium sp.]|uniref:LacI family DNA-binding transcriptional regulator n=1 Tax=Microbacterium sp. TaxID=51671 RepID=UPI002810F039|nr:LacI family DNA-binding transcriptional regulator [Microbacterium sp.]
MATADSPTPRLTIRELAAELGVSHAAVSYALNGKAGVSEETRARVVEAARERGWQPNTAARALAGQGTDSIGLVLAREPDALASDTFYLRFIAGIQAALSPRGMTLTFQIADSLASEIEVYRRWAAQGRVDGVIVVDPRIDDPRPAVLVRLGMPAVLVGGQGHAEQTLAAVGADDASPMAELVQVLRERGHRRIAYVAGPSDFAHAVDRAESYREAMTRAGVAPLTVIHTHYGADEAAAAWRALRPSEPTAIIADNDQLAVAVLRCARADAVAVPEKLSIVSWEDSPLCEATSPPLSALWRDPFALGRRSAAAILAEISEHSAEAIAIEAAVLRDRGSIADAPQAH